MDMLAFVIVAIVFFVAGLLVMRFEGKKAQSLLQVQLANATSKIDQLNAQIKAKLP